MLPRYESLSSELSEGKEMVNALIAGVGRVGDKMTDLPRIKFVS